MRNIENKLNNIFLKFPGVVGLMLSMTTSAGAQTNDFTATRVDYSPKTTEPKTADNRQITVAQFDAEIIRQRGLDPAIASYFKRAPRFNPGEISVAVTVNGIVLGRKKALFNENGNLCFTADFVRSVGLIHMTAPDQNHGNEDASDACPQYTYFSPRTIVTLQPTSLSVDIATPAEFVTFIPAIITEQGGSAGLINYRAYSLSSRFAGQSGSEYRQLDSTLGLNAGDWIFRSQQMYTESSGAAGRQSRLRTQNTYGQKTFSDKEQVFQAGRTFIQSPLYGGMAFTGAQWFPETALRSDNKFAVKGLASSRARVEIRQNGGLLYSTIVPPGPFAVNDFSIPNRSIDLQVKIIEENGSEQNFIIPASTLMLAGDNTIAQGLSISAGRLWDTSDFGGLKQSPFMTASQGWRLNNQVSGIAGGLFAPNYTSGGFGINTRLSWPIKWIYLGGVVARETQHGLSGAQGTLGFSLVASDSLQFGFSGNLRTRGYRSIQEVKSETFQTGNPGGYATQVSGNILWNAGIFGGLSTSVTRQTYFQGSAAYIYSAGWNFSLGRTQFSVGLTHNAARESGILNSTKQGNGTSYLYASMIVPLGENVTSTSYVRRSNESSQNATQIGTGIDQRINEYFGYRATTENSLGVSASTNSSISASIVPKYTSMTVGTSQTRNSSSYYAESRGGVVIHPDGIAFSPYAVQDTFGMVTVGDVAGVRLDTPQGPVWSGPAGLAAVPLLIPYYESRIEVSGKSLPEDIDVEDGLQVVKAGRGAVVKMSMNATRVRRVLLLVTTANGAALPSGSAILKGEGEYFTASAAGGRVLITDLKEGQKYVGQINGDKECVFHDIKIVARIEGEQFERGTARCE